MTQVETIVKALKRGEKLTPLSALKRYGVGRLASRVYDARKAGEKILAELVEVKPGVRVSQYWIKRAA
jgi:hypothetical protein